MSGSASHRRHALSRRRFLIGGLALSGGLAGAGLVTSSPVAPAWAASAGTPKRGGTLIAAQEVDPVSLDPQHGRELLLPAGI